MLLTNSLHYLALGKVSMLNILKHWKDIRAWWDTPLGQWFLQSEATIVKKCLSSFFGYHFLLLGEPQFIQCVIDSPIHHRIWIHPHTCFHPNSSPIRSRQDKLPLLSDSIDVIYLAHCLEFINNPHEVLRETFRVLIPKGHIIITHFNPWSLWGLWRLVMRYIKRVPWDGRSISIVRLKDWLALLGFEVITLQSHCFRPPIMNIGVWQRLKWLEKLGSLCWPFLGGGYVLIACKQVIPLTPIRPKVVTTRSFVADTLTEPVGSEYTKKS